MWVQQSQAKMLSHIDLIGLFMYHYIYAQLGCGISKMVGPKGQLISKCLFGVINSSKLSLEKNVFTKKWSPKLIFINEILF